MGMLNWWRNRRDKSPYSNLENNEAINRVTLAIMEEKLKAAAHETREAAASANIAETDLVTTQFNLRPSYIRQVALRYDGLEWLCIYGGDGDLRSALVGRGDAPEKAMRDFDHKWFGLEN